MQVRVALGLLAALGAVLAIAGVWDGRLAVKVNRWPTAPGVVQTSTIGSQRETYKSKGVTRERSFHWPDVTYTYEVNGTPYTGTEVSPFSPKQPRLADSILGNTYFRAETLANRYRPEQAVMVRYDPDAPGKAYLEAELSAGAYLGLLLAVALPGALGYVLLRRKEE
jgi:hypothetical protein